MSDLFLLSEDQMARISPYFLWHMAFRASTIAV
jgi:hypothetical protein